MRRASCKWLRDSKFHRHDGLRRLEAGANLPASSPHHRSHCITFLQFVVYSTRLMVAFGLMMCCRRADAFLTAGQRRPVLIHIIVSWESYHAHNTLCYSTRYNIKSAFFSFNVGTCLASCEIIKSQAVIANIVLTYPLHNTTFLSPLILSETRKRSETKHTYAVCESRFSY
jgi:hypothetical protein